MAEDPEGARPDPRLARLQDFGYAVAWRQAGWTECLLWRAEERWLGRGGDQREALEDALAQAFPSHAAREALAACVRAAFPRSAIEAPRVAASVAPAAAEDPAASMPAAALESETAPEVASAEVPVPVPEDARVLPPEPSHPEPSPPEASPPEPRPAGREPAPPLPPRRRMPTIGRAEAFDHLDDLARTIDAQRVEAALWVSERQRLLLLGWISHARSLQEASIHDREVRERVYAFAKRISALAKIWWPGSVHALKIDAIPRDCGGDLDLEGGGVLESWLDVAEAAGERLTALEERDEGEGRDEFGWSDASALSPGAPDPDAALGEIVRELESLAGTLRVSAEEYGPPPRSPRNRAEGPDPLESVDPLAWEKLAARVRWLRGSTSDLETWGAAIGRLRFVAARLPPRRRVRLQDLLDPLYGPERTWALAVGYDPERKARLRRRRDILDGAPRSEEAPSDERLVDWVRQAFDLEDDLSVGEIARALEPFRDRIARLPSSALAERRHRRRLRVLQAALVGGEAEALPTLLEATDEVQAPDGFGAPGASGARGELEPARPRSRTLEERLLESLRPRTRGARVLIVCNRADPELDVKLKEAFEFGSVDRCDTAPRRVEAASERVSAGSYDFVLGATGFLPHKVDGPLHKACKAARVPYVRVNRGRPLACALHLARELGVVQPAL